MNKRQKDRWTYTILLIICVVGFWYFENFYSPDSYSTSTDDQDKTPVPGFVMPSSTTGQIVVHDHFQLSYNEAYEQAEWVIYTLRKGHLTDHNRQRPDFIEDPYLKSRSAGWRNFKGSGYDRGHLCPAGDRRFSEMAYRETFYTSNIAPQNPEFNAGIWNDLEIQVRLWAREYEELYVITGGILEKGLSVIGEEDVAVPIKYFKIVARGDQNDLKILSFLIPNAPVSRSLKAYLVSVDQLEELSGVDFFAALPPDIEGKLEARIIQKGWRFTTIR